MCQSLQELNRTCRAMQQRVVELISRVSNEEVTEELLHVNDDLNNIFLRYERYDQSDFICVAQQRLFLSQCCVVVEIFCCLNKTLVGKLTTIFAHPIAELETFDQICCCFIAWGLFYWRLKSLNIQ